jgi:riboflavin kinase / FMN adenylyltransferase
VFLSRRGHRVAAVIDKLKARGFVSPYLRAFVVARINPDGLELSSSTVRRALAKDGDVALAQNVLGRPYRLRGTVENGDHRGRVLGYPTANLAIPDYMTLPSDGIYAGLVSGHEQNAPDEQPALVYVGTRPTFWQTERQVEVFLIDFSGDLYGSELSVQFLERIRGDQRFASPDELVEQMHRDEAAGREIFKRLGVLDTITR